MTRTKCFLIDDVCSFLTPRLVQRLRESGREIVGVFSPGDGPDAKRRLLECGITDVIEADASPDEFLTATIATLAHSQVSTPILQHRSEGFRIGVVGSGPGTGVTELSISLASHLASLGHGAHGLEPVVACPGAKTRSARASQSAHGRRLGAPRSCSPSGVFARRRSLDRRRRACQPRCRSDGLAPRDSSLLDDLARGKAFWLPTRARWRTTGSTLHRFDVFFWSASELRWG